MDWVLQLCNGRSAGSTVDILTKLLGTREIRDVLRAVAHSMELVAAAAVDGAVEAGLDGGAT